MIKTHVNIILFVILGVGSAWAFQPLHAPVMLIAGDGTPGYKDGNFNEAKFEGLNSLLLDEKQNILYVADGKNGAIRRIELHQGNRVSTLVGKSGHGNQDGSFSAGKLQAPAQMVWGENTSTIYVTDPGNHQIKKIDLAHGRLSTLCGDKQSGLQDGKGKEARFNNPQGLLYISRGKQLLVADAGNSALRLIDTVTGQTHTVFKSSLLKMEFQYLFIDTKGVLFAALKNKPGVWTFRLNPGQRLSINELIAFAGNQQDYKLQAEVFQLPDNEITALTTCGHRLFYSFKQPEFGRQESPLQMLSLYTMSEPLAIDYHKWLPSQELEINPEAKNQPPQPLQRYRLYHAANGMAYHSLNEQIFIADEKNHRIIAVRLHRRGDFPKGTYYPPQKPPGVKRIMLFGNSMNYNIADRPDEKKRNLEFSDSLSKRIEYWMNVMALSRHNPARYEVIYAGGAMFYSIPSVSYAFANFGKISGLQIDLVLYNYTYFDLVFDAMRYLKNPCINGKLQHHGYDPEFLLTPVRERKLHHLGKKLLDYIMNYPEKIGSFAKFAKSHIKTNDQNTMDALQVKENREIFFKLAANELERYHKYIKEYNQKESKKVGLVINLIPVQANISNNEILTSFRQGAETTPNFLNAKLETWCQSKNIGFQDTIEMAKIIEPSVFPLFSVKGNYHYSARGADLIAFLTASQLLEYFE